MREFYQRESKLRSELTPYSIFLLFLLQVRLLLFDFCDTVLRCVLVRSFIGGTATKVVRAEVVLWRVEKRWLTSGSEFASSDSFESTFCWAFKTFSTVKKAGSICSVYKLESLPKNLPYGRSEALCRTSFREVTGGFLESTCVLFIMKRFFCSSYEISKVPRC